VCNNVTVSLCVVSDVICLVNKTKFIYNNFELQLLLTEVQGERMMNASSHLTCNKHQKTTRNNNTFLLRSTKEIKEYMSL
jgi:hypothetical protein